jgi:serine phosphatase RsbU (regulator of sigma subunit)
VSSRPFLGERVSGDLIWFRKVDNILYLALIDALGHGTEANRMAVIIESALENSAFSTLKKMVSIMHESAKSDLGAAASLLRIDTSNGNFECVTVGNTTVRLTRDQQPYDPPSTPGVLGQSMRTPVSYTTKLVGGEVIFVFSDGVGSDFEQSMYPRLARMSAEAISRLTLRKYGKSVDVASVAVIKYQSS